MNIACGKRTSLNQLLDILKAALDSKVSPVYKEPRKGDVKYSLAEISRAKQSIDYNPAVDIETGLKRTLDYFRKQKS